MSEAIRKHVAGLKAELETLEQQIKADEKNYARTTQKFKELKQIIAKLEAE